MSIRLICMTVLVALSLSACKKEEEIPASPPADTAQSPALSISDTGSGAVAEMQSAAMDAQDATAALSEAASAAIGMANEAGKKQ
ncbi:MAG: hypothetical protein JWL63_450 [Rhodocyclales bacterium]|nr:hypothetical protein [Rhodocyclales bacterium]